MDDKAGVRNALLRLGQLMFARDPDMANEFTPDALLVGSEPGEIARGSQEINALFAGIHVRPYRQTWRWDLIDCTAEGDVGWLFAEGYVVVDDGIEERRVPYRLSGVLQLSGDRWRWRLFHGSEPSE
jgi:ketosteroid isomerase-like protein